ncbi:MAG: hypothetical protein EOP49_15790 [Sphingobacteriales bacterium]|nr:MAG: hypothetical protein EOP49_15790 [Sphingobacteriales bacterium]
MFKKLIAFFLLWGFWGFAMGAWLLLGPLRRIINYARAQAWTEKQENMAVYASMLGLVLVTAALAFFSVRYFSRSIYNPTHKYLLWIIPVLGTSIALYLFMNPNLINADSSKENQVSTQFTIGPYPEAKKLRELKAEGYTGVITLLHPAVVPFEPKLLGEEKANLKTAGLEMISIPLLPWVSDNIASIDSLRRFVKAAKGKYYVHCYLGKDRVNVARRIIMQESSGAIAGETASARSLDNTASFERGQVYKLDDKVYFTPLPTNEEYLGYVVAGGFRNIVALTDYDDADAAQTRKDEERMLSTYKIPVHSFNVNASASDNRIRQIIDSVKKMERPLLIHSFRSDLPEAKKFRELYR